MNDQHLHYRHPLLETPFHPRVAAANKHNEWAVWAGYTTAFSFGDVAMEHSALRNQSTVYDLCPMVKYKIEGPDAVAYLDRLTIRNVAKLPVEAVHYTVWCDDSGKVLDDGTLFRLDETEFMLCCQERHLPWLLDSTAGFDVRVEEITTEVAALSLQGPCSFAVLLSAGFADAAALKPFRSMRAPFGRGGIRISRTGFTGDLGYELWVEPDDALALWDRLFEAGERYGIRPIGTQALDIARLEAGFIITNTDFVPADQAVREDRARSPFELSLEWMIDFDKGHFNGRRALLAEKASGNSTWAMVGLDIEGNIPAGGSLLYHDRKTEVGYITSAVWSPSTKSNIAIALLRRPYHENNHNLWVEIYALRELQYHKLMMQAHVAKRPFFEPQRKRATPPGLF